MTGQAITETKQNAAVANVMSNMIVKPVAYATYQGAKYMLILGCTGLVIGAPVTGAQIGLIFGIAKSFFDKEEAPGTEATPSFFSDFAQATITAATKDFKQSRFASITNRFLKQAGG